MAEEEALRDPRNNKSLLGDYGGLTKKIKADSDGSILMSAGPDISETKGSQKYIFVSDAQQLFKEILIELRINNQYLKQIVGQSNEVVESDVDIGE